MGKKSGASGSGGGKNKGEAIPWPLVGGIIGVIVVLLAVLFVSSGPSSRSRRGRGGDGEQAGNDAADLAPGMDRETAQQYEQLIRTADEQVQLGPQGVIAAKQYYAQAVELMPEHPLAHFQLARVAESEKNFPAALDLYYRVLGLLHPSLVEGRKTVHTNIALLLLNAGNNTGSIHHWQKAIEADSKDAMLRFSLGNALAQTGDGAGALKQFKRAVELDKKEAKYNIVYGSMLKHAGEEAAGEEQIQQGLKKGSEQQLFQLGMFLRSKDTAVAEQIFQAIIRRFPSGHALPSVYVVLGKIYNAQGRIEEEKALYESAVEKSVFPSIHQRPMYSFPKLTSLMAQPFADDATRAALAPSIELLESKAKEIAAELQPLIEDQAKLEKDGEDLASGDWNLLSLGRNGQLVEDLLQSLPVTGEVLRKIRDEQGADLPRGSTEVSILGANSHIKAHCGPVNFRLRLHLALAAPADTAIRAGEEQRTWEEGKVLVLDDSFEHEVWNNGTATRSVLVVDVWHPALDDTDKDAIREQFSYGEPQAQSSLATFGH